MKVTENTETRESLKGYLRHGDQKAIADAAKTTRQTVSRWFAGKIKSSTVESYVLALVEKRKAEIQKAVQAI